MINKRAENSGTDLYHLEKTRASERDPSKNTLFEAPRQGFL